MIKKFKENYSIILLFLIILFFHQYIFQQFFPNNRGYIGHDWEIFLPYLMFGKIWFHNNLLSIPWFSPSFCCGNPFFADPQTMYYSLQQIIYLIFDPLISTKIFFFILSVFGYLGTFLLIKKGFKFNNYVSLLCAGLFLFNGFFVYRAIAGHVAYLSYVFIPLYCYFLIISYEKKTNHIYLALSALLFANFFHSGSGPIILIIFTSILFVILLYSHFTNDFKIFLKLFQSSIIGMLISSSKISASLFFLSNFPRQYPATEFDSLVAFIKTFFLSFFITPNQNYFNESLTSMFPFGLHEMEYSVSIVPIILIFFISKKFFTLNFYNIRFILILFIIIFIPIFLNINFFNQFQIISKIPILNSTWVQFRWMAVYILPIIIISGLIIQNLNIELKKKKYLVLILVSLLLVQNLIKDNGWHLNDQKYSIQNAINFSEKLKQGISQEIIGPAVILDKSGTPKKSDNKNDMFFFSYSPLMCNQAIFGYGLENLKKKKITFNSKKILQDNSAMYFSNKLDEKDGNFMFFNPSCFLFPEENNCKPGDTFTILDKEKLIKFSSYEKFEFKQNKFQIITNYVSIFSFIICLLYLIYHFFIFIYNIRKKY
tara:strand:+ start:54 stop:1850 length:1797 start_codon:yes stop_codon:yes gene_type:complete